MDEATQAAILASLDEIDELTLQIRNKHTDCREETDGIYALTDKILELLGEPKEGKIA